MRFKVLKRRWNITRKQAHGERLLRMAGVADVAAARVLWEEPSAPVHTRCLAARAIGLLSKDGPEPLRLDVDDDESPLSRAWRHGIRDGRHVDDSLAPIWAKLHDEGLTGMTMLGRHLLDSGQLRDGIGLDEVRDVLWNYLAIDTYERLVLSQGWPLERYSRWLARAITSAICP